MDEEIINEPVIDHSNSGSEPSTTVGSEHVTGTNSVPFGPSSADLPPTPSHPTSDTDTSDEVVLFMSRSSDIFRYGVVDDEVIVGHKGKRFSRLEADKLKEIARNNSVELLERGLGDII